MSKERSGHKHVICTNIQPPLGSHWPCRGRRLLLGPSATTPSLLAWPGVSGWRPGRREGKPGCGRAPRSRQEGPGEARASPRPDSWGWLSAEGRPSILMSRRAFWEGLHFRSAEAPASPALTAPPSSRKPTALGRDLASWISTGIRTPHPPDTTLGFPQTVSFYGVPQLRDDTTTQPPRLVFQK